MIDQAAKGETLRRLHSGAPFIIPNPWDAGSARVLEVLGFAAIATTSFGFAFTLGRRDGGVTLDEVCDHAARIAAVTRIPLSVDLENGYSAEPSGVAEAVRRIAATGAVGASIEDYDPNSGIYDMQLAVERIRAAVEAARSLPFAFTLTARAENLIRGRPDLEDTIRRLQAYEAAGADVLFAPGLQSIDEIRRVCAALSKPVNVLAVPSLSVALIAEAGAQRISVGGRLTWTAVQAMAGVAGRMLERGEFSGLAAPPPLDDWLP